MQVLPTVERVRGVPGADAAVLPGGDAVAAGLGGTHVARHAARRQPGTAACLRTGSHPAATHRCLRRQVCQELPWRGPGLRAFRR